MKKYTKANFRMIFTCIILPIILFFITISSCYAFFTSQARKQYWQNTTALLQVSFNKNNHSISINSQTITANQEVLPGDKMEIKGTLENIGSTNAYCILVLSINITKTGSDSEDYTFAKAFSLSNSKFVEITGTENNYSIQAFTLECANANKTNQYFINFALPFTFDGETFDSTFEDADITYDVSAYAIQQDNIEGGLQSATNILMENI